MVADYIIIGQGICGTLLSWQLMQAGCKVVVIDEPRPHTSSRVASGLINPVTGQRHVKSWMIDELMPVALDTYHKLAQELGMPVVKEYSLLNFFPGREEVATFNERVAGKSAYLYFLEEPEIWQYYFHFHFAVGVVQPCWLVNLPAMLPAWRQRLAASGSLLEERFNWADCIVKQDSVHYNGIQARKIICCDGTASFSQPYFSALPFSMNKGEVIIASIPALPREYLYTQGIKIIPWKDDLFWIGSSFDWKYDNLEPTPAFRKKVEDQLNYWLKLPFTIVDHFAADRPSSVDYKPFVGLHPVHPAIGILNGMGAKGCSQAPYFAAQMRELLVHNKPILPDADVQRFKRVLSR